MRQCEKIWYSQTGVVYLMMLQLQSLHSVGNIRMEITWVIRVMILTGETEVPKEKPLPVPLRAPQIQHELDCDRTRYSSVTA